MSPHIGLKPYRLIQPKHSYALYFVIFSPAQPIYTVLVNMKNSGLLLSMMKCCSLATALNDHAVHGNLARHLLLSLLDIGVSRPTADSTDMEEKDLKYSTGLSAKPR
jgi:hypothetical protein